MEQAFFLAANGIIAPHAICYQLFDSSSNEFTIS